MKKIFYESDPVLYDVALSLPLSSTTFGQASFELANRHTGLVDAPAFDAQGVPLAGTNYLAELWGSATPNSLTPLVNLDQGLRQETTPFLSGGYFISGRAFLSVLTVQPSGWAWLQVRAWDARLGATYEEVAARGLGGYGESTLFFAQGGNPTIGLPTPPGPLIGLESFSLRQVVPEPSAPLLLLVGLPLLFIRRRRGK